MQFRIISDVVRTAQAETEIIAYVIMILKISDQLGNVD